MGPYKPLRTWVDEFIPYYMEIMGVDRPWHILSILPFIVFRDFSSDPQGHEKTPSYKRDPYEIPILQRILIGVVWE